MIYRPNSKVTGAGNAGDQFIRRVRSILNKLTPENFQKLTNEVTATDLAHKGRLKLIVSLVFEKAVDESKYCRLYALLCLRLNEEVPNYEEDGCVFTSFQRILLTKLQLEFDSRRQGNVDPGSREKRQLLGLSAFIGELYSLSLIREVTVHACLKDLLKREDPEALECLVTILETSGERLDHSKARNLMNQYFIRIERFSVSTCLPSRVRFRLLDVMDMRGREWRSRRQIAGPRPVSEIRAEYGTSMDPTKLSAPSVQPGQSKIQRETDRKLKLGCAFFAKRPVKKDNDSPVARRKEPSNGRDELLGRDEKNFYITKTFTDEPRRYQSPVRRYNEFVRPPGSTSPVKENGKNDDESKRKSFMPDFIKPHHVQAMLERSNTNGSSLKYQPPQYQARSGFPGQNINAPSPVDRVNNARNMHLRRNHGTEQLRRESPSRSSPSRSSPHRSSPGRCSPSPHRASPNSQSPIRNGNGLDNNHYSPIRNSPSRASPISPLAESDKNDIANRKMTVEESIKLAEECSMRYINGDERAITIFTSSKIPRKSQISVCEYILQKASLEGDNIGAWTNIMKQWTTHDAMQEAITNWVAQDHDSLGSNAAIIIASAISNSLVDPCSLESLFLGGKYYPVFFLVLKELFNSMGILYIQRKFGDIDLLGMMDERNRTKLRLLLAEYQLLFLRPKYRDEQYLYEERELEPSEIYRAIKSRGDLGQAAGAAINLIWEKQLDGNKVKLLLRKLLTTKAKLQNDALKAVVLAHHERGLLKGALVRQFEYLYDSDIIEEDGFQLWESDVHDQTPGRQKALLQVSPWLRWLKEADEETDDEKENQTDQKENHSDQKENQTDEVKADDVKQDGENVNGETISEKIAQLEVS